VINQESLTEVTRYLESHGVRPEYQSDCYMSQRNVEEWLIKPGIAASPAIINTMAGFHGTSFASPASEDPWKFMYLASILQSLPRGAVHGLCAGGRNWLPLTIFGIMCGVDMVRVGMEDCVFIHPHRDEKLQTSADAVRMVADLARLFGRDVASPDEAREILGIAPIQ
jgi:3-keto-5-aminohexanoate cleavage enzyme